MAFFSRREFLSKALKIMTSSIIILVTSQKKGIDLADVHVNDTHKVAIWRK